MTLGLSRGRFPGTKAPVVDGMIARLSVVVTKDAAGAPGAYFVRSAQSRVERQPVKTVDPTRPAARVKFDGGCGRAPARCESGGWQKLSDRAAVLLAFEQLGCAESSLAMASAYARERGAFGRKISSFQAIKHKLAQMYTKIQLARCHCTMVPGRSQPTLHRRPWPLAAARCSAIDALDFAAQENNPGARRHRRSWESNCHLFYRRARLNALSGSRYEWQDRLVASLERSVETGARPAGLRTTGHSSERTMRAFMK